MEDSVLLQLGVGGIFAITVIQLVFNFLDRRERQRRGSGNGTAGERSVDFWRQQSYDAARRAVDDSLPVLTAELREIRGDTTKLRESQHRLVEVMQGVSARIDTLISLEQRRMSS